MIVIFLQQQGYQRGVDARDKSDTETLSPQERDETEWIPFARNIKTVMERFSLQDWELFRHSVP